MGARFGFLSVKFDRDCPNLSTFTLLRQIYGLISAPSFPRARRLRRLIRPTLLRS
ncbi:hypothetical protein CAMRE0001_0121 [Campylobacter rectus RM3267]|uniref:Uncharacterized protein n=1 Tax=Campylobacter rectus RM3267 TaxID=553218 RepID=B9CXT2_CAMRE|nr:hypothetical protein CAMRE0001_0121 [Campylobacter rectus RM3267]